MFRGMYERALGGVNFVPSEASRWRKIYQQEEAANVRDSGYCDININFQFRIIQAIIGKLTDPQPTAEYYPLGDPEKRMFAMLYNELWRTTWSEQRMDSKVVHALNHGMVESVGYLKLIWDEEGKISSDGKAFPSERIESVNPYLILFPSEAIDHRKAEYFVHLYPMLKSTIIRRWGKKLGITVEDLAGQDFELSDRIDTGDDPDDPFGSIVVAEIQYMDYSEKKHGEQRIAICTKDIELQDVKSKFQWRGDSFPRWPIFPVVPLPKQDTIPGMCMMSFLNPIQEWIINGVATVADSMRLNTYNMLIMESICDIDPATITNKIGKTLVVPPGTMDRMKYMIPAQLPASIFVFIERLVFFLEWVSGYVEVSQGRQPGSIRSGRGLERLQQEANTGIRLQSRGLFATIYDLAKAMLWVYMNLYTEPRIVRVFGLRTSEVLDAYGAYMKQLYGKMLMAQAQDEETGRVMYNELVEKEPVDKRSQVVRKVGVDKSAAYFEVFGKDMAGEYDCRIIPDTSAEMTRAERNNLAMILAQRPDMPIELILKHFVDLPMRSENLIQEIEDYKQKAQEAQARVEAAKMAAKAGSPGGQAIPPGTNLPAVPSKPVGAEGGELGFEQMLSSLMAQT